MTATNFQAPPRLATGSHPESKTYMCAMNVISWENGDRLISDYPPCTPKPLARAIQTVNDSSCAHRKLVLDPDTLEYVRILCPPCSMTVLDAAHRTPGQPKLALPEAWQWVVELFVGKHGSIHQLDDHDEREHVRQAALIATAFAEERTPNLAHYRPMRSSGSTAVGQANHVFNLVGPPSGRLFGLGSNLHLQRETIECAGVHYVLHHTTGVPNADKARVMTEDAHRMIDAWESIVPTQQQAECAVPKELAAA